MRRVAALVPFALCAFAAACGSADRGRTPAACLGNPHTFTGALQTAPAPVSLGGAVAISDCLVPNQGAGELATVGGTLVRVATELNAGARQDPGGPPAVQLGYLVGAARRGASQTHGIHAELLRRLEAAALYSPAGKPPPQPFDRTYQKGYAAGRDDG